MLCIPIQHIKQHQRMCIHASADGVKELSTGSGILWHRAPYYRVARIKLLPSSKPSPTPRDEPNRSKICAEPFVSGIYECCRCLKTSDGNECPERRIRTVPGKVARRLTWSLEVRVEWRVCRIRM